MVRLLGNPLLLRAVLVFLAAGGAFVIGIALIRRLRQNLASEAEFDTVAPKLDNLPLHLYNTVIQQLKQQKHELQVQNQAEQRRARTTENFSQAVLSNLSSGVLVFGVNGLVKQANPAAKQILGFSSPSGMSAEGIFRTSACTSACTSDGTGPARVSDEVNAVLREGSKCRQIEADYTTPAGEKLRLAVTVSPVPDCLAQPAWSATAVSLRGSVSSNSCTARFPPKWRWSCALRWLRYPATRNSWRATATLNWLRNWRQTLPEKPLVSTSISGDFWRRSITSTDWPKAPARGIRSSNFRFEMVR
jgi:PAS domain-containing protein